MNWWHYYNRFSGPRFSEFWKERFQEPRSLLIIVGIGFDPRMLGPLQTIVGSAGASNVRCVAIDFQDGFSSDEAASTLRDRNVDGLKALFPGHALEIKPLSPDDDEGQRNVSRNAALLIKDLMPFTGATDVVVDISSMPRIIYLTVLNAVLTELVDPSSEAPLASNVNLHVVYAESAEIDKKIAKRELEPDLALIQNLSIRMDEDATEHWPRIWFPVLGEDSFDALDRIGQLVVPKDVCPVLPMQTSNARRADDITRELGEQLFDALRVDPRDIIYATEDNPFQLYRALLGAMERYGESLNVLGGVRFVMSPLSSKGLSIGALLACFEKRLRPDGQGTPTRAGFAYIETRRYEAVALTEADVGTPVSLWLTGDCYQRE